MNLVKTNIFKNLNAQANEFSKILLQFAIIDVSFRSLGILLSVRWGLLNIGWGNN